MGGRVHGNRQIGKAPPRGSEHAADKTRRDAVAPLATIMVHVGLNSGSDGCVRLAADLAEQFGAALVGVAGALLGGSGASGDFVAGEAVAADRQSLVDRLDQRGRDFRAAAAGGQVRPEWRMAVDDPTDFLAREARAADLVVIGRRETDSEAEGTLDQGMLILRAGRPVLVVPPGIDQCKGRRVLIGWKDTREARRAVRDAIPLLQGAEDVIIVEVCDEGAERDALKRIHDVANFLGRHGVDVGAKVYARATTGHASELLNLARDEGADLIVAGGYGHSRLGEWIFGGVTRDLLASSPICCFFSH